MRRVALLIVAITLPGCATTKAADPIATAHGSTYVITPSSEDPPHYAVWANDSTHESTFAADSLECATTASRVGAPASARDASQCAQTRFGWQRRWVVPGCMPVHVATVTEMTSHADSVAMGEVTELLRREILRRFRVPKNQKPATERATFSIGGEFGQVIPGTVRSLSHTGRWFGDPYMMSEGRADPSYKLNDVAAYGRSREAQDMIEQRRPTFIVDFDSRCAPGKEYE